MVYETGGDADLWFYYDENGEPVGMKRGTSRFIYRKNLQGDITGIISGITGRLMVSYKYDAWGKVTAVNVLGTTACDNLIHDNPYLYRGYRYDRETGLYYLNSRYYDPETGRFINADDYASTGQGILGCSMFIYCENNPVNRTDSLGRSWHAFCELAKAAVTEIGKAIVNMSPAYAGCLEAAAVDGPLPFGDLVGLAGAALLTIGAIGYGLSQAVQSSQIPITKEEEKAQAITTPKESKRPVVFPENPHDFKPAGLMEVTRPGTKNGRIISWMNPLSNTEVFRWDENINKPNGPHYHIYGKGHYYPKEIVPEPYSTIYFPTY